MSRDAWRDVLMTTESERLDSWKQIAAYLKRDVRTVYRWERNEGLPVHRHVHHKGGTDYAYRPELDAWRSERRAAQPGLPAATEKRRVMLAVLPLETLGAAGQDHLAPGLTEDVITHLGRLYADSIGIIARTSIVRYEGTRTPIADIGRELGVEYVVEGTVRRAADRVRITAQLIRVCDQTHVWAERYDRDLSDILTLQEEMAAAIAARIGVTLVDRRPLPSARWTDPQAYEAYLMGRFHWYKLSLRSLDVALDYFEAALARDPSFAPAYEGIARVWLMRVDTGIVPPSPARAKTREAVLKSLECDPNLESAHVTLGNYRFCHEWDWQGGAESFRRAIALNPSSAEAHFFHADLLISLGRWDEAEREMRQACDLDPRNFFFQCFNGWHLIYRGRHEEAVEQLTSIVTSEPRFASAHLGLWGAFFSLGRHAQAMLAARAFFQSIDDGEMLAVLTAVQGAASYAATMRRAGDLLAARADSNACHVPAIRVARLYAHANDRQRALEWLHRACDARESPLVHLAVGWDWRTLRDTKAFGAILRRVGLPEVANAAARRAASRNSS